MSDIVYLSTNCYLDNSSMEIVNILKPDCTIALQKQPWRFLKTLTDNPGQVIGYRDFCRILGFLESENNSSKLVSNLKAKVVAALREAGIEDEELKHIITRRGKGYRFNPPQNNIETTNTTSIFLGNINMSSKETSELVDLMLNKGFSGKMGRHTLLSMAMNGNPCAMFEIGEMCYYGYLSENGNPDYLSAYTWYLKAGQKRHPAALWTLGYMEMNRIYNPDGQDSPINYVRVYDFLNRAKSLGSPAAITSIGQLWEEGHIPSDDYSSSRSFKPANKGLAIEMYSQADKLGYHYATNRLAKAAEEAGDYKKAFSLFYRVAQMIADGYTYNKLGLMYESGKGCKRDPDEACRYYLMSVENVFPNDVTPWGMFNAGRVYCGRILGQNKTSIDSKKGLSLMFKALDNLQLKEHGQVIIEIVEVLIREAVRNIVEFDQYQRYYISLQMRCDDYIHFHNSEISSTPLIAKIIASLNKLEKLTQ